MGQYSIMQRLRETVPEETRLVESKEPTTVREGITTTGVLGLTTKEQGIVRLTETGAILITGCAHPGLSNLLAAASKLDSISEVMGGFHDFRNLVSLGNLNLISPCHCTQRKKEIEQRYPETHVGCGAGLVKEDGKVAT